MSITFVLDLLVSTHHLSLLLWTVEVPLVWFRLGTWAITC